MNSSNPLSNILIVVLIGGFLFGLNFYRFVNMDNWRVLILLKILVGLSLIGAAIWMYILPSYSQLILTPFSIDRILNSPLIQVSLFEIFVFGVILYHLKFMAAVMDLFEGEKHYYGECRAFAKWFSGKSAHWDYFVEFVTPGAQEPVRVQVRKTDFERLFSGYADDPKAAIGQRVQADIFYLPNSKMAILIR